MKGFKALLLIFLTGCAVGPNYQTPEVALPSSYYEPHDKEEIDLSELKEWWTAFNDPLLNVLIHEALSQNFDLKIAVEKIHQVRAEYQIEAAELYPKVDLTAEQRRTRISQNLFDSSFLGPPLQSLYKVGFDASWEVDIFGKRRRAKEGAYYAYEAEVNSARDVYISLLSEIAATYIQIRGLQQKVALSKRDIYIQKELLGLAEVRFIAGLDSEILPQEIEVNLEQSQALLPTLETSYRQSLHRLAVLLGKTPESLHGDFEEQGAIPISDDPIPVGLPSDLLRRRPDIRKAERVLAAATANVGEAIADLFPRFSLLGSFGFESNRTNNWFKAKSRSWSLGPNIDWPIIYFGRIRANIRAQNAKQQQALLNYEQTILTSLEDVENSLVAYYKEEERAHRYEKQVEAARRKYDLTRDKYLSGLVNFPILLDADSALVFAENNLVDSQQSLSINLVALYKSLGGEW
ncbi:MAG: efflux transporter outer membrane subunit [Simkaniaceae bacterium]|nr:MAG: efflux transporter outer membrane subunit [Simkaniaceae bacterium]